MGKLKSLQIILVIIISVLIGYYIGVNSVKFTWKNYKPSLSVVSKEAPTQLSSLDFSLFWNVWQRLENNYYDKTKLDAQKMLFGAITGLTQSLGDPYTLFLPPTQNTNFKDGLAGQFSGIGAELGIRNKQIIVIAPLDGSPAERAGIKAGDSILKVNGESTADWTLPATVEKIRGPKGTSVTLTILHKGSNTPKDIKIIRDTITVKNVTGWVKSVKEIEGIKSITGIKDKENDKVAYVRLSQFGDSTETDWSSVIRDIDLKMQTDKSIKGLILDLRNNPGGYLDDAIFISSEFLPTEAKVVGTDPCNPIKEECPTRTVRRRGLLTNSEIKVIVLINKGSASASEIVSGALRDNKRAILIGETSYGKGTIQQAEDLGNGAGLHVTIAKWLTPNGAWVNGKGLTPNIEVKLDEKNPSRDLQLEKAVLQLIK